MRRFIASIPLFVLVTVLAACDKPAAGSATILTPKEKAADTVVRLHWLGKKRLAGQPNAAKLMEIWGMPESEKLLTESLDKIAKLPGRLSQARQPTNNEPGSLLRPLLEDLTTEETYAEIRDSGELVLAVRLPDARTRLWQTNLSEALGSLTGIKPESETNGSWTLTKHDMPNTVRFERMGDWTLIALGNKTNVLLADVVERIRDRKTPQQNFSSAAWLSLEADWGKLPGWIATSRVRSYLSRLPKTELAVSGSEDGKLRTTGDFYFDEPVPMVIPPWQIPTNVINDPLITFTAARGISTFLSSVCDWKGGEIPNSAFLWSVDGLPFQSYAAFPLEQSSNFVFELSERLLKEGDKWLLANAAGWFERSTNGNALVWRGLPYLMPFVSADLIEPGFVFGGFVPRLHTNRPPPAALFQQVVGDTNLVYYNWEITGPRLEAWTYSGQLLRLVFRKEQLPPESAEAAWLNALAKKLGNSGTVVKRVTPTHFSLVRNSGIGLTAVELHLLAEWLTADQFPAGIRSLQEPRKASTHREETSPRVGGSSNAPPRRVLKR